MANSFHFDIESDALGTELMCDGRSMTALCLNDSEVDFEIELLKRQLDDVAKQMKKAIRKSARKPIEFV